MRDFIGYKSYIMHSVQQFYDEGMDLLVEMSEHMEGRLVEVVQFLGWHGSQI